MRRITGDGKLKSIIEIILGCSGIDKGCYQNFICYQDQLCLYDSGNTLIAIISYTIKGNILHWEISSVEWKKEYGSPKEIGEGNLDITEFLDKEE